MSNQLLILFGKAGAGKNYIAKIIKREYNYHFYDGDNDLLPSMKKALKNKEEFTDSMRSNFNNVLKERIHSLLNKHKKVVLTQAFFKNKYRKDILKEFENTIFIEIEADQILLKERVEKRDNEICFEYAGRINKHFEEPDFLCKKIINNSDSVNILNQLYKFDFINSK